MTQVRGSSVYACGPGASTVPCETPTLPAMASHPAPGGSSPSPALTSPREWPTGQGLCPQPAAGAEDTPSPSQGAWASGATPKIAQLSGPQIGLQPPCPDGAPGRVGSASPSHCLHLLPAHTSALGLSLKSQPPSGGHSLFWRLCGWAQQGAVPGAGEGWEGGVRRLEIGKKLVGGI